MQIVGAPLRRFLGRKRPGNLIVTTFMISMGVMVMVGGVNAMLRNQVATALDIQKISMGKLQSTFLAEMGINQFMYEVNDAPDIADPFGLTAGAATGRSYNFKPQVAMVRTEAAGVAECVVLRQTDSGDLRRFQVQARLVTAGATYRKTIDFTTRKLQGTGGQWILASYNVLQ
jgi:hypothetical protein